MPQTADVIGNKVRPTGQLAAAVTAAADLVSGIDRSACGRVGMKGRLSVLLSPSRCRRHAHRHRRHVHRADIVVVVR